MTLVLKLRGNFSLKVGACENHREKQKGLMFRENLKVGEGMLLFCLQKTTHPDILDEKHSDPS